jgi:UDPglucose 6-dehydrogenase|tara:strand:- start:5976 stop:7247 length:1272 start_codon:yes stop_codon:yes gene_type:complete
MNIGFMGLGKLGLPCALAIDARGHDVFGYDVDPAVKTILEEKELPYREEGAPELLDNHNITFCDVENLVKNSDVIFVPIQTPHDPYFEGSTRLPDERVDFDYTYLKAGIQDLSDEIERQGTDKIVIIISTVLPGTIRREIKPLISDHIKLCYNPFFIAMGTTINDFVNPEFVLFGVDDADAYSAAKDFYKTIHDKPVYECTIEEAEMIKVSYNTYITMKINLANVIMEASHKLDNVNCDNVMRGMFLANERLISTKYLLGGMGDGGGCHPRDNIALSWMAKEMDLSYDWYESLMVCREKQTEWLGDLIMEEVEKTNLQPIILGKCFKKETNLTVGSPSILLKNILLETYANVEMFDPWVDAGDPPLDTAAVFFIGTNHDAFLDYKFPEGSVVIDPWRMMNEQAGVKLIRVGDNYAGRKSGCLI